MISFIGYLFNIVFRYNYDMYPVYLPKTNFNIYEKDFEDEILKFWDSINLQKLREEKRKGEAAFILHDGPPYANGHLHMGHAENKIWKDILNRIYWQSGYDIKYILGWDAHGLPIENAVEKELKKDGIDKKNLTNQEFWDKCYNFASNWIEIQKKGFKKLGVLADYDNPYVTFKENESIGIMECIHHFVEKKLITQKYRPVLWSYVEKTALAYAEVEYKNKISQSLYVGFPVVKTNCQVLEGASLIIWTTTPWTLPANEAICYNVNFDYIVFLGDDKKYCVEKELFAQIRLFFTCIEIIENIKGKDLENTFVNHCIEEFNRNNIRPLLNGNHVDNEKGTGFVHTAPSHGEEDFEICLENNIKIVDYLDSNGCFLDNLPLVGNMHVKDADNFIINLLKERNLLIFAKEYEHSYPHSWRSKAPLIYRLTKQWFLNMKILKKNALELAEEEELGWIPLESKNRFIAMCSTRDDWCISRQRIWGVPLGIFYNEKKGEILTDPTFLKKTRMHLKKIGVKNWRECLIEDIDPSYSSNEWARVDDIVDIWFESGATHDFVLKTNNLFPADVYLEGSDQHRGWFQSSFLISATKNECSPWKNLITHGFCLDAEKKKMSKSLGNVIDPLAWDIDTLRIFFSSLQLSADISLSDNIINQSKEIVFRFKNTIKFLLGNLAISKEVESLDLYNLGKLEKWVLHKIYLLDLAYEEMLNTFCMYNFIDKLYKFCSQDLSAFYFDIKKDVLYCDFANSKERAEVITIFRILTPILIKYLSVFMPYSMEKAWQNYCKENDIDQEDNQSVHLKDRPIISNLYRDDDNYELIEKWIYLKTKVNEKIEVLRAEKKIATSYECSVKVNSEYIKELKNIFIVSEVINEKSMLNIDSIDDFEEGKESDDLVQVQLLNNKTKCPRCKFFYNDLDNQLCKRCADVILKEFK